MISIQDNLVGGLNSNRYYLLATLGRMSNV